MQVSQLTRKFSYSGMTLDDPNPAMSPEEVKSLYSATFPELLTAAVEGPETTNSTMTYTFRKSAGTKG